MGAIRSRDDWGTIKTLTTSVATRFLALGLLLAAAGCASVARPDAGALPNPAPALAFGRDTFAFPNESLTKNRDKPDLYANYCFVMARAVTQFQRFARFAPAEPRLDAAGYAERVRQVVAHAPWRDPLPAAERVVIPGVASLHELSREQEAAVKEGLGTKFWTMVHWTNWRVVFPVPGAHQESVALETLEEIRARRPVQWLVTNLPAWELNHTVIAYDFEVAAGGDVEFRVYDPNDPYAPGIITFDRAARRFVATRLFDTEVGGIRAFRMYYGPLL
jgi:hypothetical protein